MVGDLGLMKAGPSASKSVNGPGTHLWRMRSEDASVHGVMGVLVLVLSCVIFYGLGVKGQVLPLTSFYVCLVPR